MLDSTAYLVPSLSNVTLTQPTHVTASDRKHEQEEFIDHDIQRLASSATDLGEEARQAQIVNGDGNSLLSNRVAVLGSLCKKSTEIAGISQSLEIATIKYIVSEFLRFGESDRIASKLLLQMRPEIEAVVKTTYEASGWHQYTLVRVLEACQIQALRGDLHVENYFATLYEANLESPYDPDFESEAYYDHENRLQVDDAYAKAESMRRQRKSEEQDRNERKTHRAWIAFWTRMLHGCQWGPTLFWAYPDGDDSEHLPDIPKYLFRTFDEASSGESNETMVASSAIVHRNKTSRTDILSLNREERIERLCAHLKKDCFGKQDHADNLMSWTSSLLFALQYAIWRCAIGGRSPENVYICVVDTTSFPYGQFARDKWLLEHCRDNENESPKIQNEIRLREMGYDNGEYLSQGALTHEGRSNVVTLHHLIQSGLHDLYPEFNDSQKMKRWTNRVRDLRGDWAELRSTSHEEVRIALQISTACFQDLRPCELAICLLTLKNREPGEMLSAGMICSALGAQKTGEVINDVRR